jgi:hypothetical protein
MGLMGVGFAVGAVKSYEGEDTKNFKPLAGLAVATGICIIILVAAGI